MTYHGGPFDGQPLDVLAPPTPHDDGYEVRTDDDGRILGAWWRDGWKRIPWGTQPPCAELGCEDGWHSVACPMSAHIDGLEGGR